MNFNFVCFLLHTTLFAIKGSNNKKQTKQRKRSKINRCKISQTHLTRQHSSILGLIFSTQSTNDIIGYGEFAQKIRFSISLLMHTEGSGKLYISTQLVTTSLDPVLNIYYLFSKQAVACDIVIVIHLPFN